jgi:hypothetical protein
MPLLKREAVNVFEAMKTESAFVNWLKEKEAVHHNNYHVLFEEGAPDAILCQKRNLPALNYMARVIHTYSGRGVENGSAKIPFIACNPSQ